MQTRRRVARKKGRGPAPYDVHSLYGRPPLPAKVVARGMVGLERQLNAQFKAVASRRAEANRLLKRAYAPMLKSARAAASQSEDLRRSPGELLQRSRKQPLKPPEARPASSRVFTGSISATVTPPYDYQWTWSATNGAPFVESLGAAAASGGMNAFVATADHGGSSVSARAAVGIFFAPPTEEGILKLTAAPAYNYVWDDWAYWGSASTDSFLGFYVGEYDLGGAFTGAPINQQISLWNDTANGWDHNGRASTSGYPLSGEFYVDNEHVYAMWVWFGVDASSAYGQFDFIQNLGFVDMSVAVPSITWELF